MPNESFSLSEAQLQQYETWLLLRWLDNSQRIIRQSGTIYKPEFRFEYNLINALKSESLKWLKSPDSFHMEKGWMVVGTRSVEQRSDEVPTVATFGKFVDLSGFAIDSYSNAVELNTSYAGYLIHESFREEPDIEPVAIIHAHPRALTEQISTFSSVDNNYLSNLVNGSNPMPGIYLGLVSLDDNGRPILQMRTVLPKSFGHNAAITQTTSL